MSDKNKFLAAINEFFGYEIQDIRQFERDLKGDYDEYHRYQELFNFLYWYERKLTKQESEDKCVGSKSIQEQYKEIASRNDAYNGEMNALRRKLDDVKNKLEVTLKENKDLRELAIDVGKESDMFRHRNEELEIYVERLTEQNKKLKDDQEESLRIETELRGQIRRYLGALQQIRAIGRRTYKTESEAIAELALMEDE